MAISTGQSNRRETILVVGSTSFWLSKTRSPLRPPETSLLPVSGERALLDDEVTEVAPPWRHRVKPRGRPACGRVISGQETLRGPGASPSSWDSGKHLCAAAPRESRLPTEIVSEFSDARRTFARVDNLIAYLQGS